MPQALDVAKYILETIDQDDVSTMKLQKLVYYSQAYHLAWLDEPLFDEDVLAWTHGPVIYEVYREHKGKYSVEAQELDGDSSTLSGKNKFVIDRIVSALKKYSGWELRNKTHVEDPWRNHFDENASQHGEIIPKQEMRNYYMHARTM